MAPDPDCSPAYVVFDIAAAGLRKHGRPAETLRGALVDIARTDLGRDWPEEVQGRRPRVHIGRRTKYQILILEFRGDKVTLLGGPRFAGRNPSADLGETARMLSERLKSRRVAD